MPEQWYGLADTGDWPTTSYRSLYSAIAEALWPDVRVVGANQESGSLATLASQHPSALKKRTQINTSCSLVGDWFCHQVSNTKHFTFSFNFQWLYVFYLFFRSMSCEGLRTGGQMGRGWPPMMIRILLRRQLQPALWDWTTWWMRTQMETMRGCTCSEVDESL